MLKAGITGGIGSGKSIVCQVFNTLGIPVFNADEAARYLMEQDPVLRQNIAMLLGGNVYQGHKLDRAKVAALVYADKEKLTQLNALVHPATVTFGRKWMEQQSSPYVLKEAAIFFESGSYKDMDVMIGVWAPQALRTDRVMQRSHQTREQVLAIMNKQMDEEEKMKRCDYVIVNDDTTALLPQILKLHEVLLAKAWHRL